MLKTCVPKIEAAMEDLKNLMAGYEEGVQIQEEGELSQLDLLKETNEWKAAVA